MELKIDQEFKDLIPALSVDEVLNLEQSILNEGYRDSLVTWNGYLIDGHNRYAICTKHGIPFTINEMEFDSRADVEIWMIRNQKGRRNVSTYVMIGLGLKLEDLLKQKGIENKVTNSFEKLVEKETMLCQISDKPLTKNSPIDTKKEIANFANTSYDTVAKVKEIKNNAPTEVKDELEKKINSSDISINQAHKFVRAVNGNTEIAKRILSEFNKNASGSLENKTKEIIREVQKEERDKAIKEAEDKKRLILEELRKERDEKDRLERERLRKEREEKELLEKERIEKERLAREKAKKEREEQERLAREKYEKEKTEKERVRKEQQEKERLEREKKEVEQKEKNRIAKEKLEAERVEAERLRKERVRKEQLEKERIEREKKEAEHKEQQRIAREKLEPIKGRSRTSRETIIAHGHI